MPLLKRHGARSERNAGAENGLATAHDAATLPLGRGVARSTSGGREARILAHLRQSQLRLGMASSVAQPRDPDL